MKKNYNEWYLYVLIKEQKPIYVGCTKNIKNRIRIHKKNKEFTDFIVLKKYENKELAFCAENSIIRFISVFGDNNWLNEKNIHLLIEGSQKGCNNTVVFY